MARSDAPNAARRSLPPWLRPPRTGPLLILVVLLSVISIAATEARLVGLLASSLDMAIPYAIAALNLAVGVAGLRTRHKLGWSLYLVASLLGFVLIGATTPITAVSTLITVASS